MPPPTFRQRLGHAAKAAIGVLSGQQSPYHMLEGLYPSAVGAQPESGNVELLDGYRTQPWLRAVAFRVAHAVSATPWVLYRTTNKKAPRSRVIQRAHGAGRQALIKAALQEEKLTPIESHVFLDALADANSYLVGPALFLLTQVYLDVVGEAFWVKERNGLGAPIGFWPIPSYWVKSTPTVRNPFFQVQWAGWRGAIPDTEILWMTDPDPMNPYGRGTGLGRALAEEIETDTYAARHTKMTFLNRARPDLIIWPEETKYDAGTIDDANAKRLAEKWRAEHQGFWRASLPYFATRKLGVKELNQSFNDLQLTDLRKHERDIIIQVFGVPPEELGIIENSNRATIDAADFLFKRNVVVPRLELLRAYMQERLLPEYDERLIIDYVSPVEEDREFILSVATAAPHTLKVDEWRKLAGQPPLPDGQGDVFLYSKELYPVTDPRAFTPPQRAALPTPAPPTARDVVEADVLVAEWHEPLVACLDAGDYASAALIARELRSVPDWPRRAALAPAAGDAAATLGAALKALAARPINIEVPDREVHVHLPTPPLRQRVIKERDEFGYAVRVVEEEAKS